MPLNFPMAPGVPGHETQGAQAPQWWDTRAAPPAPRLCDQEVDTDGTPKDPRWNGSTRREWETGVATEGIFRAVHMMEPLTAGAANTPVLYMSFQVLHDPSYNATRDGVFIGFVDSAGNPHIIQIEAYATTAGPWPQAPAKIRTFTPQADGLHYDEVTWSGSAHPTFLDTTRVWFQDQTAPEDGQTYTWAVNVRVPITGAASGGLTNSGISLNPAAFKFYFAMIKDTAAGAVAYRWPRAAAAPFVDNAAPDRAMKFPPLTAWDTSKVGGAVGPGIALKRVDIGTLYPGDPGRISYPKTTSSAPVTNTLYADVTNSTGSTIARETLQATFRIANWGTQPWEESLTGTAWKAVGVAGAHHVNTTDIAASSVGADRRIVCDYTITGSEAAPWINGTNDDHQCVLVTLSGYRGPTAAAHEYDFVNDSAFNNLRFVQANSAIVRGAEINVPARTKVVRSRGGLLSRLPLPSPATDVYLFVQTSNMPKATPAATPMKPRDLSRILTRDRPLTAAVLAEAVPELRSRGASDRIDFERVAAQLTTIRYFVFRTTGKTIRIGGVERPLLEEQTSFGYAISHKRPIFGWDHALGGAFKKVGENLYKMTLPAGTVKQITTKVVAYEQAPPVKRQTEIFAGPVGKIQSTIPVVKNLPPIGDMTSKITSILRLR
jgi:hypothetical protein